MKHENYKPFFKNKKTYLKEFQLNNGKAYLLEMSFFRAIQNNFFRKKDFQHVENDSFEDIKQWNNFKKYYQNALSDFGKMKPSEIIDMEKVTPLWKNLSKQDQDKIIFIAKKLDKILN